MNIIVVDFETYYDSQYSLSKITTEEYIRSSLFQTIGVSVKVDDGAAVWCSGDHATIKGFLGGFDWENAIAVAHNARFDMAILNWHFDIRPKRLVDTLSMARALLGTEVGMSLSALATHFGIGTKGTEVVRALGMRREDFAPEQLAAYGEYCCNDTEMTYKLFQKLADGFPLVELRLIDLTLRMFTEPVLLLDPQRLESHFNAVQAHKHNLLLNAGRGVEGIMSNEKLAILLRDRGVEPPTKTSPTTGKEVYAFAKTDEAFKALLEHERLSVQALVAARLGVKSTLEESRTERLLQIAGRGRLPIPLRYYAAHTGRWGGDDKINMQNLTRGSPLKSAILAPKGYMFVDSDSSQIEARVLAWLAGQHDLVEAFERGEDVYKIMASAIYGKPVYKITNDERFVGKTTILGCGYGMGAEKFRAQLKNFSVDMSIEECTRIIRVYRETYPRIPSLWAEGGAVLTALFRGASTSLGRPGVLVIDDKGIRLPNDLHIKYPNLRWVAQEDGRPAYVYDNKKGRSLVPTKIYGGKLIENVCQSLARIIIGEQALTIARKYKVVMTVHDAVGFIVPEDEQERGVEFVEIVMRTRPIWALDLPLNCEARSGRSYGDCK